MPVIFQAELVAANVWTTNQKFAGWLRTYFTHLQASDFLRHCRGMTVAQMPINFHCQCAAVLVAEPAADGWNIHAGFNATSSKQVAQIMVGDTRDAHFLAGRINNTLTLLDRQDAIFACTLADQQGKLTEHFLELFKNQQSTVVVLRSWSAIQRLNDTIWLGLKSQKLIGEAETPGTALERTDLTDAQKCDKRYYQLESVLVFNRPTAGFKSGNARKFCGITCRHLLIEADNRIRPVISSSYYLSGMRH